VDIDSERLFWGKVPLLGMLFKFLIASKLYANSQKE
jgi:hypothetical protein